MQQIYSKQKTGPL